MTVVNGFFMWLEPCNGLTLVIARPLLGFVNLSPSLCCLYRKVGLRVSYFSVQCYRAGLVVSSWLWFSVHRYKFYLTHFLFSFEYQIRAFTNLRTEFKYCLNLCFAGYCYQLQVMSGNASSCSVIFVGFHLVSPGPIEGSPYMRFGLLGVVHVGGYMASVLCWLWILVC